MAADVLVAADARGILSHGLARLWPYLNGLQEGRVLEKLRNSRLASCLATSRRNKEARTGFSPIRASSYSTL